MNITPERPEDEAEIEQLLDRCFGPDRSGKTVYRLREGVESVDELDMVIREDGILRGSLRFWPVVIGDKRIPALLLGPVATAPEDRGKGYARSLIWDGLMRAWELGYRIVLLVGDQPYYGQFGFSRMSTLKMELPGPVDPKRFLGLHLEDTLITGVEGMVHKARPGEARPGCPELAANMAAA